MTTRLFHRVSVHLSADRAVLDPKEVQVLVVNLVHVVSVVTPDLKVNEEWAETTVKEVNEVILVPMAPLASKETAVHLVSMVCPDYLVIADTTVTKANLVRGGFPDHQDQFVCTAVWMMAISFHPALDRYRLRADGPRGLKATKGLRGLRGQLVPRVKVGSMGNRALPVLKELMEKRVHVGCLVSRETADQPDQSDLLDHLVLRRRLPVIPLMMNQ